MKSVYLQARTPSITPFLVFYVFVDYPEGRKQAYIYTHSEIWSIEKVSCGLTEAELQKFWILEFTPVYNGELLSRELRQTSPIQSLGNML